MGKGSSFWTLLTLSVAIHQYFKSSPFYLTYIIHSGLKLISLKSIIAYGNLCITYWNLCVTYWILCITYWILCSSLMIYKHTCRLLPLRWSVHWNEPFIKQNISVNFFGHFFNVYWSLPLLQHCWKLYERYWELFFSNMSYKIWTPMTNSFLFHFLVRFINNDRKIYNLLIFSLNIISLTMQISCKFIVWNFFKRLIFQNRFHLITDVFLIYSFIN